MSRSLRHLLPAPPSGMPPTSANSETAVKTRRVTVLAACDICRQRKIKVRCSLEWCFIAHIRHSVTANDPTAKGALDQRRFVSTKRTKAKALYWRKNESFDISRMKMNSIESCSGSSRLDLFTKHRTSSPVFEPQEIRWRSSASSRMLKSSFHLRL